MDFTTRVGGNEIQGQKKGEPNVENLSPNAGCDIDGNTISNMEKSTNARSSGWSFIKDREEKTVEPVRMLE